MYSRILTVSLAALGLCGCGSGVPTVCPAGLRFSYSPHDTTIAPGQQFTASLSFFGCGGRDRLTDTITFQSSDVSVAVVGTTTGVVIGARPGTATITASGTQYKVSALIPVEVK